MTLSFKDPSSEVIFKRKPTTEILYGGKTYSASFSIYQHPRSANIESISIKQMGVYKIDRDVYSDISVLQFSEGASQIFELISDNRDISASNVSLRVNSPSGISKTAYEGEVVLIRQPLSKSDIYHTFSMSTSTSSFSAYSYMGNDYWPTISLDLFFHSDLENDSNNWGSIPLPDMEDTDVKIAGGESNGIMDITAVTKILWYEDEERTTLSTETPFEKEMPIFGIRFFVSKPGCFSSGISGAGSPTVISSGAIPSTTLVMLGYENIKCNYWAKGSLSNDLWHNSISDIMISNGGLPIQNDVEQAFYTLPNPLIDIEFSSSSSSSSSLSSSSSSSSVNSSSSSSSLSSSSTALMTSSSSSSSESESSSSNSSSSSSMSSDSSSSKSSLSSLSSSSSSWSSYSSLSSSYSSFAYGDKLLHYKFDSIPDNLGIIIDSSGRGNDGEMAKNNGGLGPPEWIEDLGWSGSCMRFEGGGYNTDYLSMTSMGDLSIDKGTIMFWMKADAQNNSTSVPFCISSDINDKRTELLFGIDSINNRFYCSCSIDDETMWSLHTETDSFSSTIGNWTHVSIVHNGSKPSIYVNFSRVGAYFDNKDDQTTWLSSLFLATYPPTAMYLGGAPRPISPYIALGFTGLIDEIQIWSNPLDIEGMQSAYSLDSSSSSSSQTP